MSKKQDLRAQFEKADAEHTALCDRVQESANRRAALLKQLEDDATVETPEPVAAPTEAE